MAATILYITAILLIISQSQAQIESLDDDIDDVWKKNEELVNEINQPTPDFLTNGARIHEAKCQQYIWEAKQEFDVNKKLTEFHKSSNLVSVIAGRQTKPREFPHMGAVGWKGVKGDWVFLCGSFLISEEFLLTAAHCQAAPSSEIRVKPSSKPKIVRLGVDNIVNDARQPLDMKIAKFIKHPQYTGPLHKYSDIALIMLNEKVTFNKFVRPLCIRNEYTVSKAIITGWGVVNKGIAKQTSDDLRVAHVDVVQSRMCEGMLRQKKSMQWDGVRHQICAADLNGKAGTCNGDSGGPLQIQLKTDTDIPIYNAIAVTSFGFACGSSKFPTIYTNISSYIDWIENIVWKDELAKSTNKVTKDNNKNINIIDVNNEEVDLDANEYKVDRNSRNPIRNNMNSEQSDSESNQEDDRAENDRNDVPKNILNYFRYHPVYRHNFAH